MTAEIANRIKAEKIPGYLTQMAYHFYSIVPNVEVPDNVLVMVASPGPWRDGKPQQTGDDGKIKAWTEKLRNKVAFWNYCINNSKWGENYGRPGMPHTTPETIGRYYQRHKDRFYGGFLECETDHFIWGVPNIYVATKMFWNAEQNVDALLDDFYSKLFAAAAPEMKQFFKVIEKNWVENRQEIDTPLGPQSIPLTQFTIWTKIYPPEEIRRLGTLFDRAEQKVRNDTDSLKRVRFFRERFLNVMELENLPFSGKLITLEIGTRFLTDYLEGDVYFKIHRNGHNLDRCRSQFKLVESIEQQSDRMMMLVNEIKKDLKK